MSTEIIMEETTEKRLLIASCSCKECVTMMQEVVDSLFFLAARILEKQEIRLTTLESGQFNNSSPQSCLKLSGLQHELLSVDLPKGFEIISQDLNSGTIEITKSFYVVEGVLNINLEIIRNALSVVQWALDWG